MSGQAPLSDRRRGSPGAMMGGTMAKDPAFLFYSSDFLVGTYTMTDTQVGQYVRLMCLQHQHGHLDEATVLKVLVNNLDADVLCKFRMDGDGRYYNERLDAEVGKRRDYSRSRAENRTRKASYVKDMSNICDSYVEHMENENEIEIEDGVVIVNGTRIPPSIQEVRAYCRARGNAVDPEQFVNYYETRGWMAGKSKMKNWQSAVRTWERNAGSFQPKTDAAVIWATDMREGDRA